MTARQSYAADFVLVTIAVCAGIAWRLELELRWGWQSLAWLNEFHWVVPIFILLCIGWAAWVAPVRRRTEFAGVLLAFAVAVWVAVSLAFPLFFASGPAGIVKEMFFGRMAPFLDMLAPVLWGCVPLVFCSICRFFGAPVTAGKAFASSVLFILSWPLAVHVRSLFEEQGSPNLIHALKSGFVIPFLILALALPIMRVSSKQR